MSDVLTLDDLTAERLTAVFREKGHLAEGRLERVTIDFSRPTLISAIARVRLEWSADAQGRLPSRLFAKMSRPDQNPELAPLVLKEVDFYDTVAPLLPPRIVPHCYDAARDRNTNAFQPRLHDCRARYPERRRRLEAPLLRHYHAALAGHGVSGYSFEALWEDYRLSVIGRLAVPVWQSAVNIGPWVWWRHLERIFQAFADLGCGELLA